MHLWKQICESEQGAIVQSTLNNAVISEMSSRVSDLIQMNNFSVFLFVFIYLFIYLILFLLLFATKSF